MHIIIVIGIFFKMGITKFLRFKLNYINNDKQYYSIKLKL